MGKRYIAKNVECPFYHSEDAQKIYCEGVQPGSALHLAFGSKTDKSNYRKEKCITNHRQCIVAGMLYRKWGQNE